jgi:DNA gyrase subunit B
VHASVAGRGAGSRPGWTFFFRHFNELFENGHVYIAQPPLYKIKLYLKNEGALEDYLLDSVCRETVLNRGDESR